MIPSPPVAPSSNPALVVDGEKKRRAAKRTSRVFTALAVGTMIVVGLFAFRVVGAFRAAAASHPKPVGGVVVAGFPAAKAAYAGAWRANGMVLRISPSGVVDYVRRTGNLNTSIRGLPIQRFEGDDFVVGIAFATTTFAVEEPPAKVGDVWKMRVDGVELTRD